MVNEIKYRKELEHFRMQHEEVAGKIGNKMSMKVINQFDILKLKKEKLELKDKITKLEEVLVGDVVA